MKVAQDIGSNLDEPYGVESGNKTILHLALEEDDGLPYCELLIEVSWDDCFDISNCYLTNFLNSPSYGIPKLVMCI